MTPLVVATMGPRLPLRARRGRYAEAAAVTSIGLHSWRMGLVFQGE